jgi:hypothetical protein
VTVRCPACRAENTTGPHCRRCRADLELLFALEDRRARLLADARAAIIRGDGEEVVRLAGSARRLRNDDEARSLVALGHLLSGNFAAAWDGYPAGSLTSER